MSEIPETDRHTHNPLVRYFGILGPGLVTGASAAEALRPLAGEGAYLLYALGLIGTGLLAVPVLAGSASFALAEVFGWRAGLDLAPPEHPALLSCVRRRRGRRHSAGSRRDEPDPQLFLSAVINGLLAPPLLVLVMLVSSNRAIMGEHANGPWLNLLGWSATAIMTLAAVAFFALAQ